MRLVDLMRYTLLALRRQRFRSVMLLISVGLGVGAVIVLTALGEGARRYAGRICIPGQGYGDHVPRQEGNHRRHAAGHPAARTEPSRWRKWKYWGEQYRASARWRRWSSAMAPSHLKRAGGKVWW